MTIVPLPSIQTHCHFGLNQLKIIKSRDISLASKISERMVALISCISKKHRGFLGDYQEGEIKKTKCVFFAFVQIREYQRILGDHPCVSSGPPISLGWEVETDELFSLDMYEQRRYRRSRNDLIVPVHVRVRLMASLLFIVDLFFSHLGFRFSGSSMQAMHQVPFIKFRKR